MPPTFDNVGDLADRYGNWDARLRLEIPFIASSLRKHGARRDGKEGQLQQQRHAGEQQHQRLAEEVEIHTVNSAARRASRRPPHGGNPSPRWWRAPGRAPPP